MNSTGISRRGLLLSALPAALAAQAPAKQDTVIRYLETLAKPDGGYGWEQDSHSHLTTSFAVVGCYHLLKQSPPRKKALADFIREHYPMPAARHKDRPLRRFDYEQIQALLWLNEDVTAFHAEVETWT